MIPQLARSGREQRRQQILDLERENKRWPERLIEVPPERWPDGGRVVGPRWHKPVRLLRSSEFLVQVFEEPGGILRLSVNRSHVDPQTMRWLDGITWDELQDLKAQAGFGDREAVEVYPADSDVVNVGSLRHLWLLPEPLPFIWRR